MQGFGQRSGDSSAIRRTATAKRGKVSLASPMSHSIVPRIRLNNNDSFRELNFAVSQSGTFRDKRPPVETGRIVARVLALRHAIVAPSSRVSQSPGECALHPYSPRVNDVSEHLVQHTVLTTSLYNTRRAGQAAHAMCERCVTAQRVRRLSFPLSLPSPGCRCDRPLGWIRLELFSETMTKTAHAYRWTARALWFPHSGRRRADRLCVSKPGMCCGGMG